MEFGLLRSCVEGSGLFCFDPMYLFFIGFWVVWNIPCFGLDQHFGPPSRSDAKRILWNWSICLFYIFDRELAILLNNSKKQIVPQHHTSTGTQQISHLRRLAFKHSLCLCWHPWVVVTCPRSLFLSSFLKRRKPSKSFINEGKGVSLRTQPIRPWWKPKVN